MNDINCCVTFDIDWAPDEIVEYTLDILSKFAVPATFFVTHKSKLFSDMFEENSNYEVGLHPNFLLKDFNSDDSFLNHFRELRNIFPTSVGIRSHSRTVSGRLLDLFIENNFLYDANQIIPKQRDLQAYTFRSLVRFTDFWQDDVAMYMDSRVVQYSSKLLQGAGYRIFDFHPIHIFLNTPTIDFYLERKHLIGNIKELWSLRNTKLYGVRDFLSDFLSDIRSSDVRLGLLKNFALEESISKLNLID